ncbi:hypothetical protein H4582DRAFT_2063950 [Lactarius indigo]|nr:hypothetical protein H4582DRAFT_2063950 [Lactarius indigo]
MPRKNTFTIPMGDVSEVVSKTSKSKRGLRTTVKEVPFHSSKQKKSGQASNQATIVEEQSSKQQTQGVQESHTLQPIEPYEANMQDLQLDDTQPQPHTPLRTHMGQWIDIRSRYLHLLLEMEGLTRAPKCSMCTMSMQIKCSDCVGVEGVQAAKEPQTSRRRSRHTRSTSLISVEEEQAHSSGGPQPPLQALEDMHGISDTLYDFPGDVLDPSEGNTRRTRTAKSGNPLITIVNQTGVFDMDVLFCICPNAGADDEQLLQAGIFPSTFKQIETAFTFSVLDDFLADNLECKTTAQQYYSKLQSITNRMFPDHVPNLYKQLLRASRQWRDLRNRIQNGLGHLQVGDPANDGSMAIFCPACPQPGINLPDDWKDRYNDEPNQLIRTFIMDGNFSAEHMRCRTGEADVPLSAGMAFMANPNSYKAHLHSGQEISQPSTCNTYRAIEQANSSRPHLDVTGIRATACCHGFFVPTSVVDFQKGESLCKALSYNMEDIPVALVMYDIMCQYGVHFRERVEKSPELSLSSSLQLRTGIGLFHIHGHQDSCLPRFSPSYIPGAKQVDGEIIETLWAPLNNISWSIRGMSLAHRQEVLDAHMNHSNWKKMVRIVPSLLKRWKRMETGIDLSAETFNTLNARFRKKTKRWLEAENHAQSNRYEDPTLMDIYDTASSKAPSRAEIQQQLISEESRDITTHGQTSWISCGIKIQELQLAIRYQLRAYGPKINTEEVQVIENKRSRLQKLIDIFEHQGDSFLLQQKLTDDSPISPLGNYEEYDHVDDLGPPDNTDDNHSGHDFHHHTHQALDGSGMDGINPEDLPILLPSSLGWEWCVKHGAQSLARKEVQLRHAQASDSIHRIRLALGFKSALFRTQVRPANTQQTKTRAWNAIHSVDTTVHEHARIYSMARDAYRSLRQASMNLQDLPRLRAEDFHVATLVLGSEPIGQRNKQTSWIWGFGHTVEDDGTWMDDFERVHWLRARAQFERWLEEQHSIHNEAEWVPAYFHAKAKMWKKLMTIAAQDSLKGHQAYASYQMHAWEELSRSSVKALTPITDAPLKHCKVKSIHLF